MKLFRLSAWIQDRNRIQEFLQDCFVSIDVAGEPQKESLSNNLEFFKNEIHDGDYVIVPIGGSVWLGDLGDYYYREDYEHPSEQTAHRRGVTWLGVLPQEALNPQLRHFIAEHEENEAEIAEFSYPIGLAGLDVFAAQAPGGMLPGIEPHSTGSTERSDSFANEHQAKKSTSLIDDESVDAAITTLRELLQNDDPELRLRAAEILLKYAASSKNSLPNK
ncbi:hypothetical protein [Saccharibacillus sp. JS10]|uniref:hypothetical protein n=1 Tax=Saccharibacillus sp. JS10 TaxID=2950552 RepID=UPI002109F61E|nr:hypothetical protein [Saccharibacillus sp. JS10]MCQ4086436.1 hypothetical protein [Saccharibacillus sp. JS10]